MPEIQPARVRLAHGPKKSRESRSVAHIVFLHGASSFDGASLRKGQLGGGGAVVVQLAEPLAARGHRVTVLTGQPEPLDLSGVWKSVV